MMAFRLAARPVSKLRTETNPCSGDFSVTPGPLASVAAASMLGARKPGRRPCRAQRGRVLANAAPTVASVATVAEVSVSGAQQPGNLGRRPAVPADIGAGARAASAYWLYFAGFGMSDSIASTTVLFRISCASAELVASTTSNPAARRRLALAERRTVCSSTIKTMGFSSTAISGADARRDRSIGPQNFSDYPNRFIELKSA
jgi:hypothetical protein